MNNKNIILKGISFLFSAGIVIFWILYPGVVISGPYLDSAHGNYTPSPGYGVKRNPTLVPQLDGYSRGNCAHCHEQHASIGGAEPAPTGGPSKYELLANNFSGKTTNLYAQSDDVCFYCHTTSTATLQSSAFNNYTYSITFGGNPDTTPNNIFDTFNSTSYHNFNDVLSFAKNTWSSTFTSDSNPCSACHNVHIAKRSCGKPSGFFDPTKSAISKPSDHSNLWGDDSPGERMSNPTLYGTNYQPPRYYNLTNLEPDGASSDRATQAEKTPDYVTFCIDCHNSTNTISSTVLGTLKKIDWETGGGDATTSGDKHGLNSATTNICIDPPYNSTSSCTTSGLGKVLSCLDCHEPHGAPNSFLIRKEVNGGVINTVGTGTSDYGYLCRQCHMDDKDYNSTSGTANRWEAVHHCAGDYPYNQSMCGPCHGGGGGGTANPINCSNCHYHGSSRTDCDYAPTTRRTF